MEQHRAKRRAQAARRRERKVKEEAEVKSRKLDETVAASGGMGTSAPIDDAMVGTAAPSPSTPSMPSFSQQLGAAAPSPVPTVASSIDVHIPGVELRYDSSAYNSDFEDIDTDARAQADDRAPTP